MAVEGEAMAVEEEVVFTVDTSFHEISRPRSLTLKPISHGLTFGNVSWKIESTL